MLNIDKHDIQRPLQFEAKVDVSFLNRIGKSGDKLVALLDMDRLLSSGDIRGQLRPCRRCQNRGVESSKTQLK